jgi:hypothetical protein
MEPDRQDFFVEGSNAVSTAADRFVAAHERPANALV